MIINSKNTKECPNNEIIFKGIRIITDSEDCKNCKYRINPDIYFAMFNNLQINDFICIKDEK